MNFQYFRKTTTYSQMQSGGKRFYKQNWHFKEQYIQAEHKLKFWLKKYVTNFKTAQAFRGKDLFF